MKTITPFLAAALTISVATTIAQPVVFAGNGTIGYSGDGGQATTAQLSWISGFTGDAAGNIYIGDYGNQDVRKVNASGIISTYAGNQTIGFSGDGGAATIASLSLDPGNGFGSPVYSGNSNQIGMDANGNVYIDDYHNYRIRKVSPGGIITTIAGNGTAGNTGNGGIATSAQIIADGMAVDASGNVYISDYANNVIRKISTSGIISIYAGNGTSGYSGDGGAATGAQLNGPSNIIADAFGNVFVSDYLNLVIRKINSLGIISTYAGNGTSGYSGDGGVAIQAQLSPGALALNNNNELFFVDHMPVSNPGGYWSVTLRKISSTGIITTALDTNYFKMTFPGNTYHFFVSALNAIYIDANNSFYFCPDAAFCIGFIDPGRLYRINLNELSKGLADNTSINDEVIIYPNPSNGTFTIKTNDDTNQKVEVYDFTGRLVYCESLQFEKTKIDLSTLSQGTYSVRVKGDTKSTIKNIVIVK